MLKKKKQKKKQTTHTSVLHKDFSKKQQHGDNKTMANWSMWFKAMALFLN